MRYVSTCCLVKLHLRFGYRSLDKKLLLSQLIGDIFEDAEAVLTLNQIDHLRLEDNVALRILKLQSSYCFCYERILLPGQVEGSAYQSSYGSLGLGCSQIVPRLSFAMFSSREIRRDSKNLMRRKGSICHEVSSRSCRLVLRGALSLAGRSSHCVAFSLLCYAWTLIAANEDIDHRHHYRRGFSWRTICR